MKKPTITIKGATYNINDLPDSMKKEYSAEIGKMLSYIESKKNTTKANNITTKGKE